MITWTQQGNNYQLQPPATNFPIAVWLSLRERGGQSVYNISIYAGQRLIASAERTGLEAAQSYAIEWMESLQEQLAAMLRGGDRP